MAFLMVEKHLEKFLKEGIISEWLKYEGDKINKGDAILSIETEKVVWEIEAEASGVLGKPLSDVEDVVPVGTALVYILESGDEDPGLSE